MKPHPAAMPLAALFDTAAIPHRLTITPQSGIRLARANLQLEPPSLAPYRRRVRSARPGRP